MRQQRKNSPCSGFTIIELVIALTILVIAVVGLMASVSATSRMDRATRERSTATDAARLLIEESKVLFNNVDDYVLFYQGTNATADLAVLSATPAQRQAAAEAYMTAGMPNGVSAYSSLEATSGSGDHTLAKLQNAQATFAVTKIHNNLMSLSVTVAWDGALGATSVSIQTDVGK